MNRNTGGVIKLSEMPSCQPTSLKCLSSPSSVLRGNTGTRGEAYCSERRPIYLLLVHLGGDDLMHGGVRPACSDESRALASLMRDGQLLLVHLGGDDPGLRKLVADMLMVAVLA